MDRPRSRRARPAHAPSRERGVVLFIALIAMVLSVNLLGDWLRDALNPKLR